ncbi:MAG: hypothetical protein ACHP8A_05550 [Terriglobales bacterium]
MRLFRIFAASLALTLLLTSYLGVRADEWNKSTKVTFGEPVQVPGAVLPAGTYVFRLMDSQADRHIVQIFNEDRTKLIITVLAIPNYRLEPADKTVLTYDERPVNQAVALAAWFYPGDNSGQEFVYPKSRAEELSRLNHHEVPSTGSEEAYPNKSDQSTPAVAQNTAPSESKPENQVTQSETAPPAQAAPRANIASANAPTEATPAPTPAPQPEQQQQREMPHTASLLPLVGLLGVALLAMAALLRFALRA